MLLHNLRAQRETFFLIKMVITRALLYYKFYYLPACFLFQKTLHHHTSKPESWSLKLHYKSFNSGKTPWRRKKSIRIPYSYRPLQGEWWCSGSHKKMRETSLPLFTFHSNSACNKICSHLFSPIHPLSSLTRTQTHAQEVLTGGAVLTGQE